MTQLKAQGRQVEPATSSLTGVIQLGTDLGGSATAVTVPALYNVEKIGSLISLSHSYGAGTTQTDSGTSNVYQESYFAKLQSILGVHEQNTLNLGQAGSRMVAPTNIITSNAFGGWAGALQFILPNNNQNVNAATDTVISDPVVAVNGAGIIVHGVNDFSTTFDTTSADNTVRATNNNNAASHAYRTVISRMRAGVVYGSYTSAGTITWDSTLAFSAGSNVASVTQNTGSAYKTVGANAATFTITVPKNFTGGTVAVCLIGQANGVTHLTGNLASSGGITVAVAANSDFPSSGTLLIKIGSEEMLVTAGLGSNNWTVTAGNRGLNGTSAAAHSTNDVVFVATDAHKITWSGTATGATGSTFVSGQGTGNSPIGIVKRFALTSADAGLTIIGTVGGIVTGDTSAAVNFDSWWIESSTPPPVVLTNLHDFNYGNAVASTQSFISAFNTAISNVVAEFTDGWVKIADVYTPFYNRNGTLGTAMNNTDVTSTGITFTSNSSTFTPTVGMNMTFGKLSGEICTVTAVSGAHPTWTLSLLRGQGGTAKSTHSSTNWMGACDWMHTDMVHLNVRGHAVYAEIIYNTLKAMPVASTYQITENQGNWSQYSQAFAMGIMDSNWLVPQTQVNYAAGTVTQSKETAFPIYIPKTCILVGLNTIPQASSSATIRYGIYLPDATHSRPGRLLQDFGAFAYVAQTVFTTTGLYQVLRPGWYWLGATQQATAVSMSVFAASRWGGVLLGSTSAPTGTNSNGINGYLRTGISGALSDWSTYTEITGAGTSGLMVMGYQLRSIHFA